MKHFRISFIIFAAAISLMSCGKNNDTGVDIAMGVTPDRTYIVPGKGSSCVSLANAKASTTSATPTEDISELRIPYDSFRLQWKSASALTIVSLKVTVTGSGISGGSTSVSISQTELAALLGLSDLKIAANLGSATNPFEVNSTDTTRNKTAGSKYASCGLQLGGVQVSSTARSFVATVKFDLVGVATDSTGHQTPVRKSASASAQYIL